MPAIAPASYLSHGRRRSLRSRRPGRRGAALPADERRLLLPLGAHCAVGPDAAADAGLHLVPRPHGGPRVAPERRPPPPPPGGRRSSAGAAWGGGPAAGR